MTSPAKANGDRELISSDRRAPPSPPPHALVPRGARHVFNYSSSLGIGVIPEHDFDSGHVPSVTVGLGRRHETGRGDAFDSAECPVSQPIAKPPDETPPDAPQPSERWTQRARR